MVDRTSRNQLSDVIRSYMDDQITAFDFDDNLEAIRAATNDKTVRTVVRELWLYYDDCKDHYVVASKKEWDDFNRLLLLLASDAEITGTKVRRIWHSSQLVAAVSLAIFVCLAVPQGWGPGLVGLACPFGVVSMVLSWFNRRRMRRAAATAGAALSPFPNFKILRSVRHQVRDFVKIKYPNEIAHRLIPGRIEAAVPWVIWIPVWLMLSPAILLVQTLPERQ